MPEGAEQVSEDSFWFGDPGQPLFGRLTSPPTDTARGGVLLSPPIGREGRLARRALRCLALDLARNGFVVLRFDHHGTGDSSGTLDDEFDQAWMEGINQGVALLRSFGVSLVSAVGMRMGATILGTAASKYDLALSSAVLWDPCESGRTFLREVELLSALGREGATLDAAWPGRRSEYVFAADVAERIAEFSLAIPRERPLAQRVLVVTRDDRRVSDQLRSSWDAAYVEWIGTTEQGTMLETELPHSLLPISTIARVESWLAEAPFERGPVGTESLSRSAIVASSPDATPVRETAVEMGPRKLFGVVCEPADGAKGPLVVMVNGINEDHLGPSRLWVELARRWAGYGLRTVRFDFRGIGESPPISTGRQETSSKSTRPYDLSGVLRALIPEDPSASVLIGQCSGSQQALTVGLETRSQGVCAINPQVGPGILRTADRLMATEPELVRQSAQRFGGLLTRYPWIDKLFWQTSRLIFPSAYSPRLRESLVRNNTELLVLVSAQDITPFPMVPILRSIDERRLRSSAHCRVEVVSGMDHDFLMDVGRARAVAILDEHVLEKFAGVAPARSTTLQR